jgi:hypothetical protein
MKVNKKIYFLTKHTKITIHSQSKANNFLKTDPLIFSVFFKLIYLYLAS